MPPKWSVVVPSVRPTLLESFLEAWEPLFSKHDASVHVVWDTESGWASRPEWMPRGTDMVRSWGIYEAWLEGSEFTLTLDDDVRPLRNQTPGLMHEVVDIFEEYECAFNRPARSSKYFDVGDLTTAGLAMRGFPYNDRGMAIPAVQYGGWHGVLDFDGPTQLVSCPSANHEFAPVCMPVPKGTPVTTCIMNAAWRTEYAPIMWQLPMLEGKYNRFGDIWSGLIQKRWLDRHGYVMLINGTASVWHERASDPIKNVMREAPGLGINETLWEWFAEGDWLFTDNVRSMGDTYRSLIERFARHPDLDLDYAQHLLEVKDCWLALFDW